jgi:hypothetical protein
MITNERRPLDFESVYPTCDIAGFEKDLKDNKYPNISMFWGPPGLGKTTVARIIATKLLKLTQKDADSVVKRGMLSNVPGFYEFDFALHGKAADVEQVAERLHQAKVDSLLGIPSFFILDEFTEASGGKDKTESTQKKLSKMLEDAVEGPFYVIFITNDRHKVEESIESRAEEYEFKELSYDFCMRFFDENAKIINNVEIPTKVKDQLYHSVSIKAPRKLLIGLNQYLHRGVIAGETSEETATITSWVRAVNDLAVQLSKGASQAVLDIQTNNLFVVLAKLLMTRPTYDQCVLALCKYYDSTVREPDRRTLASFRFISSLIDNIQNQGEHYGPIYSYPLMGLIRLSYKWAEFRAEDITRQSVNAPKA